MAWEEPGASAEEEAWLHSFGQVLHIAERTRATAAGAALRVKAASATNSSSKPGPRSSSSSTNGRRSASGYDEDSDEDESGGSRDAGLLSIINPAIFGARGGRARREAPPPPSLAPLPMTRLSTVAMPVPSLIWLHRQCVLWYANALAPARVKLLYAAGALLLWPGLDMLLRSRLGVSVSTLLFFQVRPVGSDSITAYGSYLWVLPGRQAMYRRLSSYRVSVYRISRCIGFSKGFDVQP